jgi:hypothetical protein
MRTTLDLEKPVLDGLKSLQKKEKLPLGKIASRLLADALARESAQNFEKPMLVWNASPMKAKVNLDDKDAVAKAMDDK